MEFGTYWFLRLDKIFLIARWGLIPCFIVGIFVSFYSILFPIAWTLFGIFVIITVFSLFVRVPSSEKMEKFISSTYAELEDRIIAEFRTKNNVEVLSLQCFSNEQTKLNRWLGKRRIYGCLVMLAWVRTKDELWLYRSDLVLYKKGQVTTSRYKIDCPSDVQLNKEIISEGEAKLNVKIQNESYELLCRSDYHLNDFLTKNFNK